MYDIAIIVPQGSEDNAEKIKKKFPFAKLYRRKKTKLETIQEIVKQAKTKCVWVISSHLNYNNFNFDFRPVEDQQKQIHAWFDGKYSNTFLIPVKEFLEQPSIKLIDEFKFVNWHSEVLKTHVNIIYKELDVFFVSNGESCADDNYEFLLSHINKPVTRINGINSRTEAFKQAALQSSTNWFFLVPAKLKIDPTFDWQWKEVDIYQKQCHYVFLAKNPVNDLQYGHMATVAFNKDLVLETTNPGLDFTLSKPNEIININSGTGMFNLDPLTTWRTAFREVLKLKYFQSINPNEETEHRLNVWLSIAKGNNAQWCLQGAKDAIDYYRSIKGNYDKILLSYEWQWVDNYAKGKGYQLWK